MRRISEEQVTDRLRTDNPWWNRGGVGRSLKELRPRAYFDLFFPLVRATDVRRAVVLMGPRRVGKTVMLHQAIDRLMKEGVPGSQITYVSVDHPLYHGLSLEQLLAWSGETAGTRAGDVRYVFFDEIQYLRDWEIHLKVLTDDRPLTKVTVSGSAAAALRLRSQESGAGRFTDFLLPPLTFYEYLDLVDELDLVTHRPGDPSWRFRATDIDRLNDRFLHYLNFGGYPEAVFSPVIQADPSRFIRNDIVDKVLLRDLPSLYGISDVQELNQLFTTLAFNTAGEVSLQELARNSGAAKNTLKRYIEYLEAAFLIRVVHRIDRSAKRFKRAWSFKVCLTNPSMRAALFSPASHSSPELGHLAETAILSQWSHQERASIYYSRWRGGEVDIVSLDAARRPRWAVEVKWSDRYPDNPLQLKALISFCSANGIGDALATSRTVHKTVSAGGLSIVFVPASVYCYTLGHNVIRSKRNLPTPPGS